MRTKQEYQEALDGLKDLAQFYIDHTYYPVSKVGLNFDKGYIVEYHDLLQELIDNLPEKQYVEKTETIYVDVDKMIEYLKENKDK